MIKINNLTKKFDSHICLDNINVQFNKNEYIALMGANGAGKTTLIRSILGYYHPNNGEISINNLNPFKQRIEVLKQISFVPQLPPPIKLSVRELLKYITTSSNTSKESIMNYANEMKFDIKSNLDKSFFKLSGGMKQKMLIAVSLANDNKIIIYDEPTANLDPLARDDFYRLLNQKKENKTLLFVTHRVDEVKDIVNRQIYMDFGKIVSDKKIKE